MSLTVRVVSPSATVYEGEARSVVAPAWDGKVGILRGHAPMIALLGAGVLSIDLVGGGSREFFVAGGVLQVVDDEVTVLSEYAGDSAPGTLPEGFVRPDEVADFIADQSKGNPLV
jgi:F-type H+-transporting ATPase subunit epsilon